MPDPGMPFDEWKRRQAARHEGEPKRRQRAICRGGAKYDPALSPPNCDPTCERCMDRWLAYIDIEQGRASP